MGLTETGLACEAKEEDRFCSALYTVSLMHNDVLLSLLVSVIFFTMVKDVDCFRNDILFIIYLHLKIWFHTLQ